MKRLITSFILVLVSLPIAYAEHVDPLLDGWVRQQKDPFNRQCPFYIDNGKDTGQRCQVGCVATALESILSYHRRTIELIDVLPAWSSKTFVTEDIPAGTIVDTRLILKDYGDGTAASVGMSEEDYAAAVDAVARLSLMCGMATQMNWGLGSSGADAGNLVEPLQKIFGWKTAEYIDSYKYTPAQWREILKNELRNGRPILYTGYTQTIDGHAFVIDGFDENDRFHVNWGYGGSYDGHYYDITQLCAFANPDDTTPTDIQQGFFCNQQALILSPDEIDKTLIADSLKRTGQEIVIEEVSFDQSAMTGKFTPVTFKLRNTADIPLCSPFEIFTNATGDKDIFKEGDYGALFGVNLEPGERRTITVHCQFSQKGYRTVRVSPDDVTVLYEKRVNIAAGHADDLSISPVTAAFRCATNVPDTDIEATFTVPVANNSLLERSGSLVTYGLMNGYEVHDGDWRHYNFLYLPADGTETKTVTYKGLHPGDEHLFIVRWPWTIRQTYRFVVPEPTVVGIGSVALEPVDEDSLPDDLRHDVYDIFGRHTTTSAHGILIHNGKKILR